MYYEYGYRSGAAGLLAGLSSGVMVLGLALTVFSIVCMWRIFTKAGEPGWKCLIPFYGIYVFYKIAWEAKYFLYSILGLVLSGVLIGVGIGKNSSSAAGIGAFLLVILYAAIAVLAIIAMVKLAKRFGKSSGFAVGLILLSTIFLAILAFDNSDYDRSRTDPNQTGKSSGTNDYSSDDQNW